MKYPRLRQFAKNFLNNILVGAVVATEFLLLLYLMR